MRKELRVKRKEGELQCSVALTRDLFYECTIACIKIRHLALNIKIIFSGGLL